MSNDQWVFLVDPVWQPESDEQNPPAAAIVGGWLVTDGEVGRFDAESALRAGDAGFADRSDRHRVPAHRVVSP